MSASAVESKADRARVRKAVFAAGLGNALEWYDIILFGFMATSITAVFYPGEGLAAQLMTWATLDRKSTRLNSSHVAISYAVFCLKKKKKDEHKGQSNKYK